LQPDPQAFRPPGRWEDPKECFVEPSNGSLTPLQWQPNPLSQLPGWKEEPKKYFTKQSNGDRGMGWGKIRVKK